jgi:3-O-methylgallate 3,4-dioxygenase
MAEIVLGLASSHSPIMSLRAEQWPVFAERDPRNPALIAPWSGGHRVDYDQLLAKADPGIAATLTADNFARQFECLQNGIKTLAESVDQLRPDVLVVVGDDQDELYFDDNHPALSIFWGDSMRMLPRYGRNNQGLEYLEGYGFEDGEHPVDSELGRYLIETLIDDDFDVAHSRYLRDEYGGTIGPAGYVEKPRVTPNRPHGMGHAYTFFVTRILKGKQIPIVPVTLNTCYPPNQPTPKRCYALGQALRRAIEAWPADKRVAVAGSGGLSHFVVDEEVDWMALNAMKDRDVAAIAALPRERLNSAASEIRNWIAAAGALEHLNMEVVAYVAGYRTPAGTGGGWCCARWVP